MLPLASLFGEHVDKVEVASLINSAVNEDGRIGLSSSVSEFEDPVKLRKVPIFYFYLFLVLFYVF